MKAWSRFAVVFASVLGLAFLAPVSLADPPGDEHAVESPEWLEGTGKDLRIKLTGEVIDGSGAPATGYELQAESVTNHLRKDLAAEIDGSRFSCWVPVGSLNWFGIHLHAVAADGRQIAAATIRDFELRQAAIDGVKLQMKPGRSMEITVVHNGELVPGAFVAAQFVGARVMGRTDGDGVCRFAAVKGDGLMQLTAWTEDYRIGGYSFNRQPPRDPLGVEHTIELEPCRSETIQFVHVEDESPISNLEFVLTAGTGPPNYQFTGRIPASEMKTDEKGEAVFHWFPDWEKHRSYVEVLDPRWAKAGSEEITKGRMIVKLKKSQFENRRRVVGTVKSIKGSLAGFSVNLKSFQGEEERRSDHLFTATDEHGRFEARVLPGATYCICVNDARFVSDIIDLIPYDPATDRTMSPVLEVFPGKPVQVIATSGPNKRPIPHQGIQLETQHSYSWLENGRKRNGQSGRRWWVVTDEEGKAFTFAQPDTEIEGVLYSPEWQASETAEISSTGVTRLEFHRKIDSKRRVLGKLSLAEGVVADLGGAIVEIGSIDGETRDRLTLEANADGEFELESTSSMLGVYARTKDRKAAGVAVFDQLDEPLSIVLKPTGEFRGQLLGKEEWPLQDHAVRASLHISAPRDPDKPFPAGYFPETFETRTDSEGKYMMTGLPVEAELTLMADGIDGSDRARFLQRLYLVPDEARPLTISRLWKPSAKVSLAKRYGNLMRDCRLSNFHAMVIVYRPSKPATQFVDANLMDSGKTKEVASFMQFQARLDNSTTKESVEFLKSQGWDAPAVGSVLACAIDATGKELARIEIDSSDPEAPELAAKFVRQHAPARVDAREKWDAAFAKAKQTDRKVWVRISGRYCGPCFRMARWLDDQKEALRKDYVVLKIDTAQDLNGEEVARRLTKGVHYGIPFHAIFDPQQRMLINSVSGVGNIGHPSGYEGKRHLRKMFEETSKRLTPEQLDGLVASLSD